MPDFPHTIGIESAIEDISRTYFLRVAGIQASLGLGHCICGILGFVYNNRKNEPYPSGGVIVGPYLLLGAILSVQMYRHGTHQQVTENLLRDISENLLKQTIVLILTLLCCVCGICLVGVYFPPEHTSDCLTGCVSNINFRIAIVIVIFIAQSFIVTIYVLHRVRIISRAFGFRFPACRQ